jgi:hypothetical protein
MSGWRVNVSDDDPTGLVILGLVRPPSPVKTIKVTSDGLGKAEGPRMLLSGGATGGRPPGADAWDLSFAATPDTSTIQEDAVVETVIDGVVIDANLTAGMTASQVAAALYTAMVNAGITDAVLFGSDVLFLHDTAGQVATDVSLAFTGPDQGDSADWLEIGASIPARFTT